MAVDQQIELLRPHVRTMKKDIKRLRELDAINQGKKIIAANQPAALGRSQTGAAQAKTVQPKEQPVVRATPKTIPADTGLEKVEQYATEAEKQKLFLLKSQKTELEAQLQKFQKESGVLAGQKDKLLEEQKTWQDKLAPVTVEEQKWPLEKKIADLGTSISAISQNQAALQEKSDVIDQKITAIVAQQKELHTAILKRNMEKKREPAAPPTPPPPPQQQRTPPPTPATLKEKVAASANKEEEQRRKFMEDIEKWAQENN